MKYKDRKHAKRKYKQALLATVATMSLGVSALGGTTSAFAEEKTTGAQQEQAATDSLGAGAGGAATGADQDYTHWWGLKKFKDYCLTLDSHGITKATDVQTLDNGKEEIDTYHYTNTTGKVEPAHKIPAVEKTITNTATVTSGTEFSFGQELSIESGKVSEAVAKISAKLTAGQKFTNQDQKAISDSKKLSYGGNTYSLEPGDKMDVKYSVKNTRTTGTLETVRPFDYDLNQKWTVRGVTTDEVNQMSNANYTQIVKKPYYSNKAFPTVYGFFNHTINQMNSDALEINYHGENKNDVYIINHDTLKNAFVFDHAKQKVYFKESTANFVIDDHSFDITEEVTITNPKTNKSETYSNVVKNPIIITQ
ncbi:hypothetical protein [Bacillus sp. FDAARGOS_1420]|uniref:hypothetical protein n=1 Tax=Bacillus sp. FDAARGOS_1420 TaxID=2856338 RepID=UPI001C5A7A22|nr:hypothetical protein [Bacillus sp. FDAARGOS_1420]MBW3491123.1 hypothetical protein [Bacillus sp. FDAARGOS_1420]